MCIVLGNYADLIVSPAGGEKKCHFSKNKYFTIFFFSFSSFPHCSAKAGNFSGEKFVLHLSNLWDGWYAKRNNCRLAHLGHYGRIKNTELGKMQVEY